jgi:hypothetical protein
MSIRRVEHATVTTISTTIGAIASGAISAAAGSLNLKSYTSPANYPHVKFVLKMTFATSIGIENKVVELIARSLDVDGTADTDVPTATFRNRLVATFRLKNVTTEQVIEEDAFDVPPNAEYYLYQESGQSSSANATLKATPFTYDNVA